MTARWLLLMLFVLFPASGRADEPAKVDPKEKKAPADAGPTRVPYRLTDTHHTLVRVKINGKGPFNFIVDTGCPVMLIAESVGKKIGLEKGWSTLDKLELEGGLTLTKVKARIETPFQITGMNSMGLAGVELHGLMGYTVLAKYKMEFDYTKMQMIWTPLDFDPPPPVPLAKKDGKGGYTGMDFMASVMQLLAVFAGIGPLPPPQPRGFFGFELSERDNQVTVVQVLPKSPAATAGLKKGDRIVEAEGKEIRSVDDVLRQASKMTYGKTLRLSIERGTEKQDLKITAGDGL
jgi:serine protease DegQ